MFSQHNRVSFSWVLESSSSDPAWHRTTDCGEEGRLLACGTRQPSNNEASKSISLLSSSFR